MTGYTVATYRDGAIRVAGWYRSIGGAYAVMNSALKDEACKCQRLDGPTCGSMTAAQPGNIYGRCGICGTSMSATDAPKLVARRPVALVDHSTARASSARVAGINGNQRNAKQFGFVSQKGSQLGKTPTAMRSALRPSNRYPVAYACQVFDGNPASGVFGLPNDSLTDLVVHVGSEPRFLPTPCAQQALGGLGPFFLEVAPKSGMTLPQIGVERTAERIAVAVGCDVPKSEVNAKISGRIARRNVTHVNRHVKEKHSVAIDQVRLPTRPVKSGLLVCAAHPRHDLPTIVGQNRNSICTLPRQNALVIDDGSVRPKRRLDVFVSLVDFDHLSDGANGHLSTKAEVAADIVVGQLLQFDLVSAPVGEGYSRQRIARRIETLHRPKHGISLFGRWKKFQLHSQVHDVLYSNRSMRSQARPALSLPALKDRASRGESR